MKKIKTIIIAILCSQQFIIAQIQLDVDGSPSQSSGPVASVKTISLNSSLYGLQVNTTTSPQSTGIFSIGTEKGMYRVGHFGVGVQGECTNGYGVYGVGQNGPGGFFLNISKTMPDLVIGGNGNTNPNDDCVIASDPSLLGSDLFLRANDAVVIQLDHDDNEMGQLEIRNGMDGVILFLPKPVSHIFMVAKR